MQVACDIRGKLSMRATNLLETSSQSKVCTQNYGVRGLHTKLWGPKVMGVSILGISGLPFESLGTKCHLDMGLIERHIIYFKGEGGGFPQVRAVVNLVSPSLPVVRLNTKSARTMH